jgi:hypothetical protein
MQLQIRPGLNSASLLAHNQKLTATDRSRPPSWPEIVQAVPRTPYLCHSLVDFILVTAKVDYPSLSWILGCRQIHRLATGQQVRIG